MEEKTTEQPEVKGHILTADETSDWGNTTTIIEPGVNDERGNEVRGDKTPEKQENDDESGDDEQSPVEEEYEEPIPVVTVEDPGVYTPNDYSFEVTTYDEEGKNGKTVKVTSIEQFEELLDKDTNFGTAAALLKAQRLAVKMESNGERDLNDWQKKKESFTQQAQSAQAQQDHINNVAAEITYLVSKGKLPAVESKYANADWSDPEIAKQSGVKEQVELLNYMRKENNARQKAGLQPLGSALDAFNAMQLETRDKRVADVKKQAGEARKEASARVAGSSPAPVSNAPKGVMVGRGGSLRDLDPGW